MTSTTHPIATAWKQQLRRQGEQVLKAVVAMALPKTSIEANRVMRALMLADKMIAQFWGEPSRRGHPAQAGAGDMPDYDVSELEEAVEAFLPEPAAMNRQQRRTKHERRQNVKYND